MLSHFAGFYPMLATKLCALVGIVIASQATALIVETTDVLGRPLQYDELDRESLPRQFWSQSFKKTCHGT